MARQNGRGRGGSRPRTNGAKAGVAGGVSLLLLAAGIGAGAAEAVVNSSACPEALPTAEAVKGLVGHGLTVETGAEPEEFTATILGRITDGIAPGLDMIVADVTSPAVQRAGGIWAGMSGSPVYADDGRLIGAISYGLASTASPIAGITPAAELVKLMNRGTGATAAATTAALPSGLKSEVVQTGSATATEASGGMRQLPLPLSVAGVSAAHAAKLTSALAKGAPGARVFTSGAMSAEGAAGDPAAIVPGGNFAAAVAYGDVSAVGTGTTTMVCDGKAVAFGHPFFFSGPARMSMHSAEAVYVQPDGLSPFKVANPGPVVGTLDQDRLAGIRGLLGEGPASVPVVATITSDGESRTGTTRVNVPEMLPDIAATSVYSNIDRVIDRVGPGSSTMHWVIDGKRGDGSPFSVEGANHYISASDISAGSVGDLAEILYAIEGNDFEDAHVSAVHVDGEVTGDYTYDTIAGVSLLRPDGTWAPLSAGAPVQAEAGSQLSLRLAFKPYKSNVLRYENVVVNVPAGTAGSFGALSVRGATTSPGGFDFDDPFATPTGPADFEDLLAGVADITPNNSYDIDFSLGDPMSPDPSPVTISQRHSSDHVVLGSFGIPVAVVAPSLPGAVVVDGTSWHVRSSVTTGRATRTFTYGTGTGAALAGDWDGNGSVTPAEFANGVWTVRMKFTKAAPVSVSFGQPGDLPVAGDWDGDGDDSIGVFRPATGEWLLRNSVSAGAPDLTFTYGTPGPGVQPVVGDWDGDGIDTVGTFTAGTWAVRNSNSAGPASYTFVFGKAGDTPVVGDWEGDGRDEPGFFKAGRWRIRNSLTTGWGAAVTYGSKTGRPVVWG